MAQDLLRNKCVGLPANRLRARDAAGKLRRGAVPAGKRRDQTTSEMFGNYDEKAAPRRGRRGAATGALPTKAWPC